MPRVNPSPGGVGGSSVAQSRLDILGATEQQRSALSHRFDYETGTSFTEAWADKTAWTTADHVVSGGALFANSPYATAQTGHSWSVPAGTRSRIVYRLVVPSTAVATGSWFAFAGLNFGTAGAVPSGGSTIGMGVDPTTHKAILWRGASVGGAGQTNLSTSALAAGTYYVVVVVDELSVSLVMTDSGNTFEYRLRVDRSGSTLAPGNLAIFLNDPRAATGISIGKIGATLTSAQAPSRATYEGAGPTSALVKPTSASSSTARVFLPATWDSRKPLPLVVACHGHGRTGVSTFDDAQYGPYFRSIANAGYIVISADAQGDAWGNAASVADYEDAYRYARDHYPINGLLLHATSMGGLPSLAMLKRAIVPGILGWYGVAPVTNLRAMYDANFNGTFAAEIRTAFGIAADGSDYSTKTSGSDPALLSWTQFQGVPMRASVVSDDTTVPSATHWTALLASVTGHAPEASTFTTATGGHIADAAFSAADAVAFFGRCCAS